MAILNKADESNIWVSWNALSPVGVWAPQAGYGAMVTTFCVAACSTEIIT